MLPRPTPTVHARFLNSVGVTANNMRPAIDAGVAAAARAGEPDRYLCALLAPSPQREALMALAALSAELSSIPLRVVHEPAMADIRLQWWRDALALPAAIRTGNPVADAVREAVLQHQLSASLLDSLIDGHAHVLADGAPAGEDGLRDLLWKTDGTVFSLGARVMGLPAGLETEAACASSGYAYGLTRVLLGLPRTLRQGRVLLPTALIEGSGLTTEEMFAGASDERVGTLLAQCSAQIRRSLAVARRFAGGLSRPTRLAFLPLALVEPYLRVLERSYPALLREEGRFAPLSRVSRIAAAHLLGRF